MGLLEMFGVGDNPFYQAFDQNRGKITNAFAGMVGAGNDPRQALTGWTQGLQHGQDVDTENAIIAQQQAERRAAMDAEQQKQNQTIAALQKAGREDLIAALNGGADIGTVWNSYLVDAKDRIAAADDRAKREANAAFIPDPALAAAYLAGEMEFQDAYKMATGTGGSAASFGQQPVFLLDPQGNQRIGQMSSGGGVYIDGQVLPGIPDGWKITNRPAAMGFEDMGGYLAVTDPNRGTITPGPAIQGAPSANMDVSLNPDLTRNMTPAAGSPQAAEMTGNQVKAQSALANLELKNKVVTDKIDQALNQAGMWTTGILGQMGTALPGSPAYDLRETLKTIKANIGFEELQTMRDNSPTGGALGAITERELAFLQSTIASIEQAQSEAQLRENLVILKQYLGMSAAQRRDAFASQFGGNAAAPAPMGGGLGGTSGGSSMLPDPFGLRQ